MNNSKPYVFIIILIFSSILIGKTQEEFPIDSLKQRLSSMPKSGREYSQTKVLLAHYYVYENLDSADKYINQVFKSIEYSKSVHFENQYYQHLLIKAWVCQGNGNLHCAKDYLERCLRKIKDLNDNKAINELNLNLGSVLVDLHDSTALQFAEELIENVDTSINFYKHTWVLGHQYIARAYGNNYNYEKAISVLLKIINDPLFNKIPNLRYGVFNSLSIFLKEINDFDRSVIYLKKAISESSLYDYEYKFLFGNLAEVFYLNDELDSAQVYIDKAIQMGQHSDFDCEFLYSLKSKIELTKTYVYSALEYIMKAEECQLSMNDTLKKIENDLLKANIYLQLNKVPEAKLILQTYEHNDLTTYSNELQEAYARNKYFLSIKLNEDERLLKEKFDKYLFARKTFERSTSRQQLKELTIKHEVEKKELLINLLEAENSIIKSKVKLQKAYLLGSLFGITGLLFGIYYLLERNRKEKELYVKDVATLKRLNRVWHDKVQRSKNSKKLIKLKDDDLLILEINNKTIKLFLNDLIYLESDGNYLRIFAIQEAKRIKKHFIRHTLHSFQSEYLPSLPFVRINKSNIINMNFIKHKNAQKVFLEIESNTKEFKVGRAYKNDFEKAYNSLPEAV